MLAWVPMAESGAVPGGPWPSTPLAPQGDPRKRLAEKGLQGLSSHVALTFKFWGLFLIEI